MTTPLVRNSINPESFPLITVKLSLKLLAALVLASFCLQASAATFTVTNINDTGAGSLRQAITDANMGSDTITFDTAGVFATSQTITLTSGELLITDSVSITGPGANQLAVNGNAAGRVFDITSGINVAISGLTITNGRASNDQGGGIYNVGALTITDSALSGNSATIGGGIFNGGTLTITNSTLNGNGASGGGGIFNYFGTLTIANSTLSGNGSDNDGGGILSFNATLTITNSTLSGNSAGRNGGGIWSRAATLTIHNSTLSGNSATNAGGGIWNLGTLEIGNTILKAGTSGDNILFFDGIVTSDGYNLSSDAAGGDGTTGPGGVLNATGDQRNTDPMLGPLQDNGGPTFTHALLVGSPAIDAGDPNFNPNTFNPPLLYDQRGTGFPRVANGRIDIGAYEVQALYLPPTITVTDAAGNTVACGGIKTVSNNGQCGAVTVPLMITANGNCPGTITVASIRSDGKSVTDPYPVGSTTVSSTATDACGKTSTCTFTVRVTNNKTITSNFNGTPIPGNSYIWFNAVLKPSGLKASSGPVTVKFIDQTITSGNFSVNPPDTTVVFDPNATCARAVVTTNGQWMITAPMSGLSGNTFLSGVPYQVPAAGLPGGTKPVSWSGTFITDTAGVSLNWQWSAAVYSTFNASNAVLGVKATDDNKGDCAYHNSDHAGTPEQYKSGVTGGAMGGGGSNYTGGLSGTQTIAPCDTF